MSHTLGLMIESVVAILLAITIGYCIVLERRLRRLKADELSLKSTISELITASEIAERAIEGLKTTVRECEANLSEQLRSAQRLSLDLGRQLATGDELNTRLKRIVLASRKVTADQAAGRTGKPTPPEEPLTDTRAMLAAAQAFADRIGTRPTSAAA